MLNFSIAYGKTAHGLSKDWGVTQQEAQAMVDAWYADRPEVLAWQQSTIAKVGGRIECSHSKCSHSKCGRSKYIVLLSVAWQQSTIRKARGACMHVYARVCARACVCIACVRNTRLLDIVAHLGMHVMPFAYKGNLT